MRFVRRSAPSARELRDVGMAMTIDDAIELALR
jgi:hypothetical protein